MGQKVILADTAARSHSRLRSGLAMCVYNGGRYLQEQLDSIASQTVSLNHVVVVDDNSSDNSWELLEAWSKNCGFPVTLIRNKENIGVVRNFEKAALNVDAEIIFFADQDDVWYPDKVERMLKVFNDPNVLLAHTDANLIDDNGVPLGRKLLATLLLRDDERDRVAGGRAAEVYLMRNLVTGAACAARAELVREAVPFPVSWLHDEWLALAAGLKGSVVMLEEPTMSYRLHSANTVGLPITDWRWRLQSIRDVIFSPQLQALQRRQERLLTLRQRVATWQGPTWFLHELDALLEHIAHRLNLPSNIFLRIRHVILEWRTGRYNVWSAGELSAIHDIFSAG